MFPGVWKGMEHEREPVSGRCREHFVMSLAVAPSFDSLTSSPPHQYLLVIHLTFHAIGL